VKFTEAGGITIATEVATAASGRVLLVVHIEDTGIGIAENDIPRLFERFTQGEGGNARRYGGTGLGLAISRGLARLLGGDISVRSRPGVGSRFTLRLDLAGAEGDDAPADAPAPDATPPGCRPLDGVRVLVADDNEVNRLVVGHILQTLGASPVIVDDGFAAVERVQAEPFDVVLMDVQMPGLSGPDATRRIRRLDADVRHIPVIALTANVLANDREAYAAAGMTAHLAKPVDLAQLTDAILAATGRRAPARPAA
jgi:CheY-like chemotaxis protein